MVESSSKPRIAAQIDPSGLSDVPTKTDAIGFAPYTRAIAWSLSNSKTKAPLTISIEGPWGSGKSSFMLQLEDELKKQAGKSGRTSFI
ncbi:putative KAP-like P-loop ATPase [Bradyrhizobium sp. USDA 4470]